MKLDWFGSSAGIPQCSFNLSQPSTKPCTPVPPHLQCGDSWAASASGSRASLRSMLRSSWNWLAPVKGGRPTSCGRGQAGQARRWRWAAETCGHSRQCSQQTVCFLSLPTGTPCRPAFHSQQHSQQHSQHPPARTGWPRWTTGLPWHHTCGSAGFRGPCTAGCRTASQPGPVECKAARQPTRIMRMRAAVWPQRNTNKHAAGPACEQTARGGSPTHTPAPAAAGCVQTQSLRSSAWRWQRPPTAAGSAASGHAVAGVVRTAEDAGRWGDQLSSTSSSSSSRETGLTEHRAGCSRAGSLEPSEAQASAAQTAWCVSHVHEVVRPHLAQASRQLPHQVLCRRLWQPLDGTQQVGQVAAGTVLHNEVQPICLLQRTEEVQEKSHPLGRQDNLWLGRAGTEGRRD